MRKVINFILSLIFVMSIASCSQDAPIESVKESVKASYSVSLEEAENDLMGILGVVDNAETRGSRMMLILRREPELKKVNPIIMPTI